MPFSIPNIGDAAFDAQSEPDSVDLDILAAAIAGNGVLSGGDVSAQGTPDMTVAVSAGTVSVNGVLRVLAEDPALSLSAAHSTLDRFDLVVASPDGLGGYVPAVIEGVESDAPVFAAFDPSTGGATPVDGDVVLAAVYVPAGETAIEDANIVDKRSAPQAAADVTVDDTGMGVSGDNVQELVGSIDSALTAVQGDVADRLPLAGGVMDLDSTVRLGEWPGTTWHDTHQPVSFTEEPTLVFPIESGVLLGVFATANHFALARSVDGGTSWTAFTTWDFITGQTAVALYRFLNDTDFNTGFVNYDNLGLGSTFADRIGVGLGTDFTDVGTIDNAATSKIRWWFGTTGGHHLVPGRDLLYDLGEAARKVREVFAGTGTFSSALTVGGDAVATEDFASSEASSAASSAVAAHEAEVDPHPGYALESSLGDVATKDVGTAAGTVAAGDHNHSGVYEAVGVAAALVDDLSGVSDASTARTNLGLGDLATLDEVGVADITATGTADSTTYLRGDGTWSTPAGGGSFDLAQQIAFGG